MRSLPIIALALTCSGAVSAAETPLEPDPRRCARALPTLVDDNGPPLMDRGKADADEPLFYSAVEHRIDGCPVLVMHRTGEVRPVPQVQQRRNLFMPAR